MPVKFSLGTVVATPGALAMLEASDDTAQQFLSRHVNGDWGDVCAEDRHFNDQAIVHEGDLDKQTRVLSQYSTSNHTILWIITEWDRSVTTILLPSEY